MLYVNQVLRTAGFSFISLFIPIYLLTLGYSLNFIFLYTLFYYIFVFVFSIVAVYMGNKIGYRRLFILNIFVVIFWMFYLSVLKDFPLSIYPIFFMGLLGGIEGAFFWTPFNILFAKFGNEGRRGSQVGFLSIFNQLSSIIGPVIGAYLAVTSGFSELIYFATFFFFLSLLPLFFLENIKLKTTVSLTGLKKFYTFHKSFAYGNVFQNIFGEVQGIIWPIFIYLMFNNNLLHVGYIGSIIAVGTIVFTAIVGKLSDRIDKHILIKIGGLAFALLWVLVLFFQQPIYLYIISALFGFASLMIALPFSTITYSKAAKEEDIGEFIVWTEAASLVGRLIFIAIILIAPNKFSASFIIASLSCLYFAIARFEKKTK